MTQYRPHLLPKVRCEALRQSANEMPCTLRVASFVPGGRCSFGTTVLCHLGNVGQGTATKENDMAGAYGCAACHRLVDAVDCKDLDYIVETAPAAFMHRVLNAMIETHTIMVMRGLIIVPDSEIIGDIEPSMIGICA